MNNRIIELPLKEAIKKFPVLLDYIPHNLLFDKDYICRIEIKGNYINRLEIGYSSDDWALGSV